jgi:hypothetical protein
MSDPWLRKEKSHWMPAPQPHGLHELCVNNLLLQDKKCWDIGKIHSLYFSNIVEIIIYL